VTPRTLAECRFTTGYASAQHPRRPVPISERIYGVLLATVIGILGAAALVHGLAS
jgi:hypothetical protein